MPIDNYASSIDVDVEKNGDTYTITAKKYQMGVKVSEDSSTYTPSGGGGGDDPTPPEPVTITGVYQTLHPSSYLTDTSVQDAPLDLTGNNGLKNAFANCSALETVVLATDVDNVSGTDHSNAFYGCTALTTVTGTIDLSEVPYTGMKDMFKNCTNLASVSIVNGETTNDITAENVEVAGVTYAYAYEILGLTAEQFANAVTIVT